MVEREKFADAVIICTPDRLHKVSMQELSIAFFQVKSSLLFESIPDFDVFQEPAVAFAKKGYHILLEKPMAVSLCSDHPLITMASLGAFMLGKNTQSCPQSIKYMNKNEN